MLKHFIHTLWTLFALVVIGMVVAFTAIAEGWIGYMPAIEELQNPINRYASQVYSADGKVLGTYSYNRENRVCVDYTQLSPYLVQALVSTEDSRFYVHSGIDFYALGRSIVKRGILGQKSAGGGSTITQQLAKQLYSDAAHNTLQRALQKPIEWVIAVKLERNYTKEEIIELYLNYFDFLHNAVGIKTASNTYFSKEPASLTINEAALLVGLCKNPSYYNPVSHPDRALARRNVVLQQMHKAGHISKAQLNELSDEPIRLNFHRVDHKEGEAVYFRDMLRRYMMAKCPQRDQYPSWNYGKFVQDSLAWINDPLFGWCNKNQKKDGSNYNVYEDGLKIYTTIDSRMQKYAEEAMHEHVVRYLQPLFNAECRQKKNAPFTEELTYEQVAQILNKSMRQTDRYRAMKEIGASDEEIKRAFNTPTRMEVFTYNGSKDTTMTPMDSIRYYKRFLRSGFISMEPQTGYVKAYVGGTDFTHFQYDMVSDGRRQVGSTIKPLLYALAMENGFSPCDKAPNVQQTYMVAGQPWTPRNASHSRYGEMVTLKWGLAQSNNWISAYLMSKLSPHAFVSLIRSFGISNPAIHPSMSLCLGPCEFTVQELVSAYTAFANNGIRTAPCYVSRIEDNEGNILATFAPIMNEVISEESAYKMLVLLQGVVDGGTGSRIRYKYNLNCQMGGKTGTTNRNSDAWFVGFTPSLVSACWVGGEERDIHFDSMNIGQGASMALPVWALYMKKVFGDSRLGYNPEAVFDLPEGYDPCVTSPELDDMYELEDVYE